MEKRSKTRGAHEKSDSGYFLRHNLGADKKKPKPSMSEWEARFADYWKLHAPKTTLIHRCLRLPLEDAAVCAPNFVAFSKTGIICIMLGVRGFEADLEDLKTFRKAAERYASPCVKFVLAVRSVKNVAHGVFADFEMIRYSE